MPRARSRRTRPTLPGQQPPEIRVVELRERADRLHAAGDETFLRLRPDARQAPDVERREEARFASAGTTMSPPGLRWSLAIFATTFDVETPSEHVRLCSAHGCLHGLGDLACRRKSPATSPMSR